MFVHVSQDIEAEYQHSTAEEYEARLTTKEWPAAHKVRFKKTEFGDDEKDADRTRNEVGDAVKEVEL